MFSPDRYVIALQLAAARHRDQVVTGTQLPYVVHVVSVAAEVIAAITRDRVSDPDLAVITALLHDTLEDTETDRDELARLFGNGIADGVQALTKNKSHPHPMADSLDRIRMQPREIWIVKLADRTVNMAPPPASWTLEKRRAYRAEALTIHAALGAACPSLAERLKSRTDAYAAFC